MPPVPVLPKIAHRTMRKISGCAACEIPGPQLRSAGVPPNGSVTLLDLTGLHSQGLPLSASVLVRVRFGAGMRARRGVAAQERAKRGRV